MNKEIHDKIVNLIPSESLKTAIKETHFEFPEIALFRIIDACAPNIEKRIEYYEFLRDNLCGEMAEYVEVCIKYERALLEEFVNNTKNIVFEVSVRDYERYIFKDFETAVEFTKHYHTIEHAVPVKIYHIAKKKLRGIDDITPNYLEDADLCTVIDGKIRDIWCETIEYEHYIYKNKDVRKYRWHWNEEEEFPKYIALGDVIKYPDRYGNTKYAIVLIAPEEDFDRVKCVKLDSPAVRYRAFDKHFHAHDHPSPYYVEKADVSELDDKMREDYLAFRQYLGLTDDM